MQAAEEAASEAKGELFNALASFDARLETEAERWQSRTAAQQEAWAEGQSEHVGALLQVRVHRHDPFVQERGILVGARRARGWASSSQGLCRA